MSAIGTPEDSAQHLVEHGERGVGENGLHFAREHDEGCTAARRVETGKMLRAYDRAFAGDCRVTGAMNALLAVSSDAELAHGFELFHDLDEVPLARRFRPFPQPSKRRTLFAFSHDEQCL